MAMAVASARYESEDAYPIDYREIFFRDPSLPFFNFFFFFFFFNFFTAQTFRDSFDQRVQTKRPRDLSTVYVFISVSCMPIKLKSICEIIMKS